MMTGPDSHASGQSHDSRQPNVTDGDSHSLRVLCKQIHHKINAFLQEESKEERVVDAQSQCRNSMNIIGEAIKRYPYFYDSSLIPRSSQADHLHKAAEPLLLL